MAIGWLTVLKMLPWGEVIDNAPKVAAGAKKLWAKVGAQPAAVVDSAEIAVGSGSQAVSGAQALAALQAQVAELQVATAALHQQMRESSALIESLAEQNAQLVQRVDLHRRHLFWQSLLCVALVGVCWFLVLR